MAKIRQDAWTEEDDLLLAETVLRHIREGSTQLNAFEEVGDLLNRTSAACGFRWNAEVRNSYIQAIELAKRQRKERKRREANIAKTNIKQPKTKPSTPLIFESEIDLEQIIHYLQTLQENFSLQTNQQSELEALQTENKNLQQLNNELQKEKEKIKERLVTLEEDYTTFIQIMDRARKMTLLDEQGQQPSTSFRMDKNGNLEQLGGS